MRSYTLAVLIAVLFLPGANAVCQQDGYKIPEANITLDLPNQNWHLTDHSGISMVRYTFKRDPITDSSGNDIIPAIMVVVEDAKAYDGDIIAFAVEKRAPFSKLGVHVDSSYFPVDKGYPVPCKNSLMFECSYESGNMPHILIMIYLITRTNKAVAVYLDITRNLEAEFGQEFWKTIRSLREINI
jgi:hypothetical protein